MGTVNSNFLPATTGLSLGSVMQQWLLNGSVPWLSQAIIPVTFSLTPTFAASGPGIAWFTMTLSGPVSSSTLTITSSSPVLIVFQFTQDVVGNRTFVWPVNVFGGATVQGPANQVLIQMFIWNGSSAYALTPGNPF